MTTREEIKALREEIAELRAEIVRLKAGAQFRPQQPAPALTRPTCEPVHPWPRPTSPITPTFIS